MRQEIIHPIFGYRISYRRVLEVQARLLGRYLTGEINEYPAFLTRWGGFTAIDRIEMQAAIEAVINRDEDKVLIIDLGPSDPFPVKNIQGLGKQVKVVKRAAIVAWLPSVSSAIVVKIFRLTLADQRIAK
jgi:hypothetical protein